MHHVGDVDEVPRVVLAHLEPSFTGLADFDDATHESGVGQAKGGAGPEGDGQHAVLAVGGEHILLGNGLGEV